MRFPFQSMISHKCLSHELEMALPSMWHPLQWQSALHKTPTPSVHCSLANDLVCGSFPDQAANLWEWLAQSYIKLFALSSNCDTLVWRILKITKLPNQTDSGEFHKLNECAKSYKSLCVLSAHICACSDMKTHTNTLSFSSCSKHTWTFWLYHTYLLKITHQQQKYVLLQQKNKSVFSQSRSLKM